MMRSPTAALCVIAIASCKYEDKLDAPMFEKKKPAKDWHKRQKPKHKKRKR